MIVITEILAEYCEPLHCDNLKYVLSLHHIIVVVVVAVGVGSSSTFLFFHKIVVTDDGRCC